VSVAFATAPAGAAPWISVTDNEVGETSWGRNQVRHLGIPAVRVFLWWEGEESPDAPRPGARLQRDGLGCPGVRNRYAALPVLVHADDQGLRARYAEYVARLVEQTGVRDVLVWNEPNLKGFWGGEVDPVLYAKLLARAYDRLAPMGVRTWAFSTARVRHDEADSGRRRLVSPEQASSPALSRCQPPSLLASGEAWNATHTGGAVPTPSAIRDACSPSSTVRSPGRPNTNGAARPRSSTGSLAGQPAP